MNNLKIMKVRCLPIDDIKGQVIYVSLGEERKKKEVYYLKDHTLFCVDLVEGEEFVLGTEIKNVIHADYMFTHNKITVSTSFSIIIIDCDTKNFYKRDFEKEAQQTAWNNNFDYLAVVFGDGTVRTFMADMMFQLKQVGEGNIASTVQQKESVGWGSNTTQFQGPGKVEEIQPLGQHLSPTDNCKFGVCWRGNSEEFVVNYMECGIREFKVFDHLCVPKAKSELQAGQMYGPITWKPEGTIIAAAIFQDHKNYVGLFERNGLFKMLFPLVDIYYPIIFMSWSSCGRVLNLTQEDDKGQKHVCLYATSNDKWYLKQHLVFPRSNTLWHITWTATSAECVELLAVTRNEVLQYKYKFEFDVDHLNNLVVAIDGKTIRIHGFKESVDPSPSSTNVIMIDNPVNMIAFHPSKELAAAIDSSNILYVFSVDNIELYVKIETFLGKAVFPLHMNHLFWKGNNPCVLMEKSSECSSSLFEFDMVTRELSKKQQFDVTLYAVEHICAVDNVVITQDGKYTTIHRVGENPLTTPNLPYPLHVIPLKYSNDVFCLILTPEQEFYVDKDLVHKGITSMLLYKDFLLLTDNKTLYSLKLSRHSIETLADDGLSEFHSRPLNEIAYLVCMMADTPNIVLHTPRGNLEIISCRPMELRIVENYLSQSEWSKAIKFMRMARLNWNLLIDLNSDRFYGNLAAIVPECNLQRVLNSIVAEINDDNCLTTIYKNAVDVIPYVVPHKKRDFLDQLGEFLNQNGAFSEYLPTLLKICVDQDNVKKAMTYLSFILSSTNAADIVKVEFAITLLKVHVQVEEIFKAALQVFDVKLADMVSKKCQMNPQEIDPLLKELSMKDPLDIRIAVHLRYQNYEEAVAYMLRKDNLDQEEILDFIRKNDVAKRAHLESLKLNITFKEAIAQLYVQKLISNGYHGEAAIILIQYVFYDEAVHQFKLALDYKKCVEYLPLSSLDDDDKKKLFADLADKLLAANRMQEAADIYENHLEDYVGAVKTLADSKLFREALMVARKHSLYDYIDLDILPKMVTTMQSCNAQVEETAKKFKKFSERLRKLRNIKKYRFEQLKKRSRTARDDEESTIASGDSLGSHNNRSTGKERIAEVENCFFQSDSEVQSVISVGSRRSSRSSSSSASTITQKQVRKIERQRQDTTEGSRFEDIALMREMHIMIAQIFKMGPEVRELFLRLLEYSVMDMNALMCHQTKILDLQQLMIDEVHTIWDEQFKPEYNVVHVSENYCFMDPKFRTIPAEIEHPGLTWVLEMLKK